jgi:hypothetical protein
MAFQTIKFVKAPNSAGKNFIQKIEFPSSKIIYEIQEVKGATD